MEEGRRGRKREKDVGWMIDGENRTDQSPWLRTGEDISSRRRCRDCTFGASLSRTPGARGKPRVQGRSLRRAISVILPPPVTRPPPEDSPGIFSHARATPPSQPATRKSFPTFFLHDPPLYSHFPNHQRDFSLSIIAKQTISKGETEREGEKTSLSGGETGFPRRLTST